MQSHIPMWIFLLSISFSPFAAFATIRKMYVPDERLSYLTEPEEPARFCLVWKFADCDAKLLYIHEYQQEVLGLANVTGTWHFLHGSMVEFQCHG